MGAEIGVTATTDGFGMVALAGIVGGAGELAITCGTNMADCACATRAPTGVMARISGINDPDDIVITTVIETDELVAIPGVGIPEVPVIAGIGAVMPCTTGAGTVAVATAVGT